MHNVHLPVSVVHEEGEALHLGRGVHSGGEDPQLGVESSPGPQIQPEGPALLVRHSEPFRQVPNKIFGDSDGPEYLSSQPRWLRGEGVSYGVLVRR